MAQVNLAILSIVFYKKKKKGKHSLIITLKQECLKLDKIQELNSSFSWT